MGSAGNGRRTKRRAGTKAIDKCQNGGPSREIENSDLIVIIPGIARSICPTIVTASESTRQACMGKTKYF